MESLQRPQQHPGEGTHGVRDRLRKGLYGCTGRKHHRDWSKTMCGRVGSKSPRSTLGCQKHTADTAVEQKVICCLELAHRVLSMHFLRTQRKEMHARGEEEKPQQASHCMSERQDHQSSHGTACHSTLLQCGASLLVSMRGPFTTRAGRGSCAVRWDDGESWTNTLHIFANIVRKM